MRKYEKKATFSKFKKAYWALHLSPFGHLIIHGFAY